MKMSEVPSRYVSKRVSEHVIAEIHQGVVLVARGRMDGAYLNLRNKLLHTEAYLNTLFINHDVDELLKELEGF